MQVNCLEEPAFYNLIDKVVFYIKEKFDVKEDKWIIPDEVTVGLIIGYRSVYCIS